MYLCRLCVYTFRLSQKQQRRRRLLSAAPSPYVQKSYTRGQRLSTVFAGRSGGGAHESRQKVHALLCGLDIFRPVQYYLGQHRTILSAGLLCQIFRQVV